MTPQKLEEALYWHGQYRQPVITLAQPGVGKSSLKNKVFKRLGFKNVIPVNLALSDGTDMKGLPSFVDVEGGKAVKWIKEAVFLRKDPVVVFLDEIFQGVTQVQNAAAPILLENRVDDIYLPAGSWVCGASNRAEDKAGTSRVPSHIPNRVTLLYGPDVSIDQFSEYLLDGGSSKKITGEYEAPLPAPKERDIRVIQFCRMKGEKALTGFDPNQLVNCTPRQMEWVAQFMPVMPEDLRFDIIGGRIGEGLAAELKAFVQIADQLPPREKILLDPKKAPVPEEPSALYLVTGMLAQVATPDNFDAIATYMKRVRPEFQAMLVKDAMRSSPGITSTKAFVDWGVKFAEVLR